MSDSEFSDTEFEENYGPTSVLLGFADEKVKDETSITAEDNILGGRPVWYSSPPKELTVCKNCNSPLRQLCQISAPLDGTFYDRTLYVLVCVSKDCRRKDGSVRAIRSIRRDPEREAAEKAKLEQEKEQEELKKKAGISKAAEVSQSIFGGDQDSNDNPFGANPFDKSPFQSDQLKKSPGEEKNKKSDASVERNVPENPKTTSDLDSSPAFPSYYIEVEGEVLEAPSADIDTSNVEIDDEVDVEESGSSGLKGQQKDLAQMVEGAITDEVFQKFVNVTGSNPEQVVRYERNLEPLLYNGEDDIAKSLKHGLNERVLELQLMPHAIMVLEGEDDIMDGMEWGTIFVATRENDEDIELTNGVGYVEDWVGVQWEQR
uniref:ARAD1B21120p n=1 Tax=Blastobotrys adeninivorans TaxID=409370 RepID=A0A060T770_BLAAD